MEKDNRRLLLLSRRGAAEQQAARRRLFVLLRDVHIIQPSSSRKLQQVLAKNTADGARQQTVSAWQLVGGSARHLEIIRLWNSNMGLCVPNHQRARPDD